MQSRPSRKDIRFLFAWRHGTAKLVKSVRFGVKHVGMYHYVDDQGWTEFHEHDTDLAWLHEILGECDREGRALVLSIREIRRKKL